MYQALAPEFANLSSGFRCQVLAPPGGDNIGPCFCKRKRDGFAHTRSTTHDDRYTAAKTEEIKRHGPHLIRLRKGYNAGEMNHTRRDLSLLLPALLAAAQADGRQTKEVLPSECYPFDKLKVKTNEKTHNESRQVFDGMTHEGYPIELHSQHLLPDKRRTRRITTCMRR